MREIKFRAWWKKYRNWETFTVPMFGEFDENEFENWSQFTGLKDKNGKEIYEGDVLQTVMGIVGETTFYEGHFMLDVGKGVRMYVSDEYEIIGNIYESPELLK